MTRVYEIEANIELNLQAIVQKVKEEYGEETTADDVYKYIEQHLIGPQPTRRTIGIYEASDGPSYNGFVYSDDVDEEIKELLAEV